MKHTHYVDSLLIKTRILYDVSVIPIKMRL